MPVKEKFPDLFAAISGEMTELENRLARETANSLGRAGGGLDHVARSGGKRLRPALVILTARLGEAVDDDALYAAAMAVEYLHDATLIHDDLIDGADTRRGHPTIHTQYSAGQAIVVGDHYLAKSTALLAGTGNAKLAELGAQTVITLCEGEMLQSAARYLWSQTPEKYYAVVEHKTSSLLACCCKLGGMLAGLGDAKCESLAGYGHDLGLAFQVADDVLDYDSSQAETGKPVGNDLREGTVTLPLILALQSGVNRAELTAIINSEDLTAGAAARVVALVRAGDAIEKSRERAREWSAKAKKRLRVFPASPFRDALENLTEYVVSRTF